MNVFAPALSRTKLVSLTLITVSLSFALPFVFHLVPQSGIPLGARFLPIFYAPLLAAAFFPGVVALVTSLLAPLLNHLLLGNPPLPMTAQLTAELLIFSAAVLLLKKYAPLWFSAPLGYLIAKLLVFFVAMPVTILQLDAWRAVGSSLVVALPGLVLLALLGLFAQWQKGRR